MLFPAKRLGRDGAVRPKTRPLRLESLEPRVLLSGATPTVYDQYLLELVNRARMDPLGEAARYGISLNEGVPPADTISPDPKQPLAMNLSLLDSAQQHTQWMIDTDTFDHYGAGGSDPGDRMAAAGYPFVPPWGWGENIAMYQQTPTVPPMASTTELLHRNLFVDDGYPGRGHRTNMLDPDFKEVGTAVLAGGWDGWNAVVCTEDFAYSGTASYLTGVAYDDSAVLDDDFYTPGEGLGGVSVVATRQSDGTQFTTSTWASGGYTLLLPAGTYDVTASGGGLVGTVAYGDVAIGSLNVKLDFTPDLVPRFPDLAVTDGQGSPTDRAIDFGSLDVLTGSLAHTVTLANTGDGPLAISGLTLGDTANFSIAWDGNGQAPTSILPGASRVATITFDPATTGAFATAFTIDTNDPDEPTVAVALEGEGTFSSGIQARYVGTIAAGQTARVHIFDCDGVADIALADIRVRAGRGDSISSITLGGTQPMTGLGIVITGATSVGKITDSRRAPGAGDGSGYGEVAFIASNVGLKSVSLKSGITGYTLDGLEVGGLAFGDDPDADGEPDDLTGFWAGGSVGSLSLYGDLTGDVVVHGDLGKLYGRAGLNADVVVDGALKTLSLAGDWQGRLLAAWIGTAKTKGTLTADITTTSFYPRTGASIGTLQAGIVAGATVDVPGGVKSISVLEWPDGSIQAAWLGSLSTRVDRKVGNSGDFGAALSLSGEAAGKYTLRSAKIAGAIACGTWDIGGSVGSIKAGSVDSAWILDAEGYVNSLYGSAGLSGSMSALWFGSVKTKGELSGDLTATGVGRGNVAISTLQAGWMIDATVDAGDGGIKSIKTYGWQGGGVAAAWLRSLSCAASRTLVLPGDFAADLDLSGAGSPKQTLGKATIAGKLSGVDWEVSGVVSKLDVGLWGAGSILAVGVAPGAGGVLFDADDVPGSGRVSYLTVRAYEAGDGAGFGVTAAEMGRVKLGRVTLPSRGLPFHDGSFYVVAAADLLHKGVALPLWDENVNRSQLKASLDNLAALGVNWVELNVFWFQDDVDSTVIAPDFSLYSASDASVKLAIDEAHRRGMRVMLKPVVSLRDDPAHWRGDILGSAEWFTGAQGYGAFMAHWADLAQQKGVEMLCVGTELTAATAQEGQWRTLIADLRSRYSGPLVYAANHGGEASATEADIAWWDALDYIGLDAYYPLTDKTDPTPAELAAAWAERAAMIEDWLAALDPADRKPILFTEVGYRSWDGTNRAPYDGSAWGATNVDPQEQADCYAALFSTLWGQRGWFYGTYWWNWEVDPNPTWEAPNWYTPQGKPAEDVLRLYYA